MKLRIEYLDVSSLAEYAKNARTHSPAQVAQIANSIREFGFNNPVLIDGNGEIIAGHGRVLAAKQLNMEQVPCVVLGHLSERQKRAYVLADNKIALNSGWDFAKLSDELSYLADVEFDLSLTGFDEQELDALLRDDASILPEGALEPEKIPVGAYERNPPKHGNTDENEVPDEPTKPTTKVGDVWILGNHKLLCGDSTNAGDVAILMAGEKADMVFTDPPYNVKISGLSNGGSDNLNSISKIHGEFVMASGEMSEEEFSGFLSKVFENLKANSKDGSIHYVCMDWRHMKEMLTAGEVYESRTTVGGGELSALKQLIVWNKDRGGLGSFYRSKHELIFVFKVGKAKHTNNFMLGETGRYRTNVWDYPMVLTFMHRTDEGEGTPDMHPTVKPVSMIVDACLDCSNEGEIVLDLFGGSGSTLIACEKTNRFARLMELYPKYCDVIIKRWQEFTGMEVFHENGKTFEQIKQERERDDFNT